MSTHRLALRLPRVREPSLTQDTPGATSPIGRSAANLSVTLGCGMGRSSHLTPDAVECDGKRDFVLTWRLLRTLRQRTDVSGKYAAGQRVERRAAPRFHSSRSAFVTDSSP